MLHKFIHFIKNLTPLAETVLLGGLGIAAAMQLAAFLMTVFGDASYEGYLIYLAARQIPSFSLVVACETLCCALVVDSVAEKK